ncbi:MULTISPECIES: hypothetical protein [Arthrospira]|jgi:multisubunit Na+/H+ antiporter MnhB subunit|uniref:Uncharacterized protein n=1 Tax=Limnospira platensis NIES-46 TaxID=1236695 RepID=A0A5M3TBC4_LIMPL|nr:hypothetical protein [Arthrospira platensis]MBD2668582.1 hypothetical protein [Arthrospira platensis FACHB-439]MBD2709263.1 hypothetical protein [Arthrospira platensis FACHB-835]MDF2211327.1 hypothetical protein [Arthrospira platensis NCB002]MDT9181723.1 hypothetical protein [Limnospira sp. PMC 289.06]MDT9294981.1 hypothetical protein [Arthrospira platensis PCC 7345]MDT9309319.1 hypothetical protein [Limnospira sp. Paracas R14]QQW29932.1 hypothetical protein AP9108_03645 [Arthrospira sp. 
MAVLLTWIALILSILLTETFWLDPLSFLNWLHLPNWTGLAFVGLIVAWCLGE